MTRKRAGKRRTAGKKSTPSAEDAAGRAASISLGPLADYVGFRMRRVHDIQTREFLRLTRDENLTQGMFTALALISANPGSSQASLAQEMGLHTSAMVSLIDDLEKREWVVRQKDALDRRRYQLVLTAVGEEALDRLLRILDEVESSSLKALTASELKAMTRALDKLYTAYRGTDASVPRSRRTGAG
ncbi:MAG TPA: MarR family transcriptional regulator [Woeseiaceae bacterium]|nr:MarR family transcriptional regulator [Woeseiaceae bacterium]